MEKKLSGVAEVIYKMLYGKCEFKESKGSYNKMKSYLLVNGLAAIGFSMTVFAADPSSFQAHMIDSHANSDGPDYVQHQAAGNGWFSNLGPTGIRAMLTDINGLTEWQGQGIQYLVKYVFPGSPADGLILPGDIITGVNGRQFQKVYVFGYWYGFGYEGPLTEFGEAVEESERDFGGILTLIVERDGQSIEVPVQIESKGVFADTFPYNCSKSASLRREAVQTLINLQKDNGSWPGQGHAGFMACMALLAQGTQGDHMQAVEKYLDRMNPSGITDATWNWHLAMNAIAMAEYQMLTGNEKYRDYLLAVNDQLKRNNDRYKNHTYGHVGLAEGSAGYGPMKGTTSFVLLAWAVMENAGIPIHSDAMEKTLVEMDMAGCAGYGWPDQGSAVVTLDISTVLSTLNELNRNINDKNTLYRTAGFPYGNVALLHTIRPWQSYSPQIVTNNVKKIAFSRNAMVTGHGSGMLHGWSTLSALCMAYNRGVTEPLRISLDYNKALLNSARCHDGSFYTQPQRDDYGGDLSKGSRTTATALWLTILSSPENNLTVLGHLDDPNAPTVFAGPESMTWSGNGLQLEPVVVEQVGSSWTDLTYSWTADPADGVVFTDPDDPSNPNPSEVQAPVVTITKDTDDPSVVKLTLSVYNQVGLGSPVEDSMTVNVYEDACKMTRIGLGMAAENPTDLDGNCITNLADFAEIASKWLSGGALPTAVWK